MTRPHVPAAILDLAHRRRAAREAHDWAEADALRAAMEADGWTVIDHGVDFDLRPLRPPDVVEGDVVRYGSSASVPSRLEETASAPATIVVLATDRVDDAARAARTADAESIDGTQVVVVAERPDATEEEALAALEAEGIEVVRTATRLGPAAARNAAIRRARGAIVVLLGLDVDVTGDIVLPLEAPFRDPSVGVAGGWGLAGGELRVLAAAPPGEVDSVDLSCLAFRRMDFMERGPLDEHLRTERHLGTWWSLALRDQGEGAAPLRATTVHLPVGRRVGPDGSDAGSAPNDRAAKRDFYRVLDRFGGRSDLFSSAATDPAPARGTRPTA